MLSAKVRQKDSRSSTRICHLSRRFSTSCRKRKWKKREREATSTKRSVSRSSSIGKSSTSAFSSSPTFDFRRSAAVKMANIDSVFGRMFTEPRTRDNRVRSFFTSFDFVSNGKIRLEFARSTGRTVLLRGRVCRSRWFQRIHSLEEEVAWQRFDERKIFSIGSFFLFAQVSVSR